jgi:hypothetical protein
MKPVPIKHSMHTTAQSGNMSSGRDGCTNSCRTNEIERAAARLQQEREGEDKHQAKTPQSYHHWSDRLVDTRRPAAQRSWRIARSSGLSHCLKASSIKLRRMPATKRSPAVAAAAWSASELLYRRLVQSASTVEAISNGQLLLTCPVMLDTPCG